MRVAVLVPDPGYEEPWRWAYDVEADALTAAGASVDPVVWTDCGDLDAFDLVLPLVAWGYHFDSSRGAIISITSAGLGCSRGPRRRAGR